MSPVMGEDDRKTTHNALICLALCFAALIVIGTLIRVASFTPTLALPEARPHSSHFTSMEAIAASSEALRDKISFLTTLTFGLIAIVGFIVKDGLGKCTIQICMNINLIALFGCLIATSFLKAFDAYNMVSIQLLEGMLFATLIDSLIADQALFLIMAVVVSLFLLNTRITCSPLFQ